MIRYMIIFITMLISFTTGLSLIKFIQSDKNHAIEKQFGSIYTTDLTMTKYGPVMMYIRDTSNSVCYMATIISVKCTEGKCK